MKLDDVIKKMRDEIIEARACGDGYKKHDPRTCTGYYHEAAIVERWADYLTTHRAEIEAGMRPVLRFRLGYEELMPNKKLYIITLLGDKPVGNQGPYGQPQYLSLRGFYERDEAIILMEALAASLGLRAEFVEEGS